MSLYQIAVISDIHGNLSALKACLKDIAKANPDEIVCLGDIVAKGFHNHECIELIRKNCSTVLTGNCDEYFSRDLSSFENEREIRLVSEYQKTMSEEDCLYLASLPFSYECRLSGRLIRMFHAGPDSVNNYTSNTLYASADQKYSMFLPSDKTESQKTADVVIFGHVHEQMLNRLYNRTLVCAGSVGNAFDLIRNPAKDGPVSNTVNAQYVLISGEKNSEEGVFNISFQSVPYDVSEELAGMKDFFEYDEFAFELLEGRYRNFDKIRKILLKDGIDLNEV